MLAELAEFGLSTKSPARVDAILDTLSADSDIAYVVVLDTKREPIAARRIGDAIGATAGPPPLAPDARLPEPGTIVASDVTTRGQRYLEMIAPVSGARAAAATGPSPVTADAAKASTTSAPARRRRSATFDSASRSTASSSSFASTWSARSR